MKIVILGRIPRITVFQIGELGDLFEFTFVPVVYQENIVPVIGRQYQYRLRVLFRKDGWKNK